MALSTEHKLYIGIGIALALGGAFYLQSLQNKKEAASYSAEAAVADLPKLEITEDTTKEITKIELNSPGDPDADKDEDKKPLKIVLEKDGKGDDAKWKLTSPLKAKANDANVKSLLGNLEKLSVSDRIASGTETYDKYEVSDKKALHAVFFKGGDKIADLYLGSSGSRGEMTRFAGKDGVYALQGYSQFLYKRDLRGWRDREIFKFDEKKAKTVKLDNETGSFEFTKDGGTWKGTLDGKSIKDFDPKKLENMLRTFKGLNADNFGDDKKPADVGLDDPVATLTIILDDDAKRVLYVGANAEGEARWAKKAGSDLIFSITSWAANWTTAETEKFQEKKEEDKDKNDAVTPPPVDLPGDDD